MHLYPAHKNMPQFVINSYTKATVQNHTYFYQYIVLVKISADIAHATVDINTVRSGEVFNDKAASFAMTTLHC